MEPIEHTLRFCNPLMKIERAPPPAASLGSQRFKFLAWNQSGVECPRHEPSSSMSFSGIDIAPFWRVLPSGVPVEALGPAQGGMSVIRIDSGPGFGVGTHETTQLCMLALGHLQRSGHRAARVLDFGSGSGILAIAAALSGASVSAIECQTAAVEHARHNAQLNAVDDRISFDTELRDSSEQFDLVLANILNQVLLEHAEPLCRRVRRDGRLILSGLFATDVPGVLARYKGLLAPMQPQIFERGHWRAIMFVPA